MLYENSSTKMHNISHFEYFNNATQHLKIIHQVQPTNSKQTMITYWSTYLPFLLTTKYNAKAEITHQCTRPKIKK